MLKRPSIRQLVRAAKIIATATDAATATYCFDGRLAVELAAGWSLAISPDDAGRFRIEACLSGHVRSTMWVLVGNDRRLAELASVAQVEAAALVA